MGSAIVNLNYNSASGVSKYCCGTPVGTDEGNGTDCQYGYDSFALNDATIIGGHNALADYTLTSTSSNSSTSANSSSVSSTSSPGTNTSSHDVALGVGLGVPLGVIALGSLLWAFWERKRANQLSRALAASNIPAQGFTGTPHTPQPRLMTERSGLTELESTWHPQEMPVK
ncbi:hypothetical protein N7448_000834 [Penicillium atrosanguineum]|uniref:Uncharacterized protein n=1 Tax=Penicillium atrosanguineum TaxID=1132637 RepID=A0A9W9HL73_9EURO|nr:Glucose/ribitol dehydrogenase [Penicillium atrosanguineum]KAJ5134143.1 hypothetical protein N7526_005508 [Penicillium atrosanguineum]KAJ5149256.1 hypothetical protein N7448_000834 [Penicillium atrosanguineum]KAJ5304569.1 Glucose/ribitol dehydrogenase [Penicillium atrosanguineum]KAJ5324038.1 hypothetical protein N7476_002638 [Penicillium atrosanguineum]